MTSTTGSSPEKKIQKKFIASNMKPNIGHVQGQVPKKCGVNVGSRPGSFQKKKKANIDHNLPGSRSCSTDFFLAGSGRVLSEMQGQDWNNFENSLSPSLRVCLSDIGT